MTEQQRDWQAASRELQREDMPLDAGDRTPSPAFGAVKDPESRSRAGHAVVSAFPRRAPNLVVCVYFPP